jgi:Holliday junction DNA helicase RuvB
MAIIPSYSNKIPEKLPGVAESSQAAGSELEPNKALSGKSDAGRAAKPRRSQILNAKESNQDKNADQSLRPRQLNDYIGQSRLKAILAMSIGAAKSRGEPLDHLLFYGPPGLGKTTLAHVIANEMGSKVHLTSGPSLERPRDIIGLIHQLEPGDVLFIDEIHRLSSVAEELLYPAVEDFVIDLTAGKGHATRSMRLELPRFTLIGATTRAGMISNALRDRFGHVYRLEYYEHDELCQIVKRTATILGIDTTAEGVSEIALRGRGTPRITNRLVRLVRDFAQFKGEPTIDERIAKDALNTYQVDEIGLDPTDRKFLEIIVDIYKGGPVGLDTLAHTLGEDANTLEDVYEPFLIQKGFLQRTARGRMATALAYTHLKRPSPGGQIMLDLNTRE